MEAFEIRPSPGEPNIRNHKTYRRIVCIEQRSVYVQHFNAEYKEYLRFYKALMGVSDQFVRLQLEINKYGVGTPVYMAGVEKKRQLHKMYQDDPEYHYVIDQYNFLHNKLAHIKSLVAEYDHAQRMNWRSMAFVAQYGPLRH